MDRFYAATEIEFPANVIQAAIALCITRTDGTNYVRSQHCEWKLLALQLPSLGNLVLGIVSNRSKKQVRRVYAWWIVAAMENTDTIGNWANEQFVGCPISQYVVVAWGTRSDQTVPAFIATSCPGYAPVRLFATDVAEEAVNEGNGIFRVAAFRRAKLSAPLSDHAWQHEECALAYRADNGDFDRLTRHAESPTRFSVFGQA